MMLPASEWKRNPMTEENIYAPPKASLELEADLPISQVFYVVSKRKFCTLYIATLGLYQVYWYYKNWVQYKKATNADIWPIARAIFPVFFTHSLFALVERRILLKEKSSAWKPSLHATIMVILMIVSYPIDRITDQNAYSIVLMLAAAISLFMGFFIAQEKINLACGAPKGEGNDAFTPANYIWMLLGVLYWINVAYTIFHYYRNTKNCNILAEVLSGGGLNLYV